MKIISYILSVCSALFADVNAGDIYYGCHRVLLFAGFEK